MDFVKEFSRDDIQFINQLPHKETIDSRIFLKDIHAPL